VNYEEQNEAKKVLKKTIFEKSENVDKGKKQILMALIIFYAVDNTNETTLKRSVKKWNDLWDEMVEQIQADDYSRNVWVSF
jgi:hypothetical protein